MHPSTILALLPPLAAAQSLSFCETWSPTHDWMDVCCPSLTVEVDGYPCSLSAAEYVGNITECTQDKDASGWSCCVESIPTGPDGTYKSACAANDFINANFSQQHDEVPFAGTLDDLDWVMKSVIISLPEEDAMKMDGAGKGWMRGKASL